MKNKINVDTINHEWKYRARTAEANEHMLTFFPNAVSVDEEAKPKRRENLSDLKAWKFKVARTYLELIVKTRCILP